MSKLKHNRISGLLYFAVLLIMMFCFSHQAYAQAERKFIREGNRLYNKELFDESELSYRRALEKDKESPGARFNLGNALYKQERFDEALRYFGELSEEVDDPLNKSKIYHNMGNSMLLLQQIEQSIEAYKEALRNNPDDQESRYNLAFAQHLLDEMEDQQQDGNENQDGEGQDEEGQESNQQDQEGGQNPEDSHQSPDQQDNNQSPDHEQAQQPRPDQISPEEAMRMLEAAEREDKRVQEKLIEEKASEIQPRTGRIW